MPTQTVPRPDSENYQSLLVEPRTKVQRRRKICLWTVVIFVLLLLILIPLGVLLWKYYSGDLVIKLKQSPIDIMTSKAVYDDLLVDGRFVFNYDHESVDKIINTGHGWKIDLNKNSNDTLNAVHLPGTYRLLQIHAHWDPVGNQNGSEHTVNGMGFAGEIHLVHYNLKYKSFGDALNYKDGLAVLGIFLSVSDYLNEPSVTVNIIFHVVYIKENDDNVDNPNLEPIVDLMKDIIYKNQSVVLDSFHFRNLLPRNTSQFWTYDGSLTTKPFSECVVWTVFRQGIPISYNQLRRFRMLKRTLKEKSSSADQDDLHDDHDDHDEDKAHDVHGYVRLAQPLNGRIVKASFKLGVKSR